MLVAGVCSLSCTIQLLLSHFDHISVLVVIMLSAINILINMGLACMALINQWFVFPVPISPDQTLASMYPLKMDGIVAYLIVAKQCV